jgi:hypothetical protein
MCQGDRGLWIEDVKILRPQAVGQALADGRPHLHMRHRHQ